MSISRKVALLYLYLTMDFKLNENAALRGHLEGSLREQIMWWLVGGRRVLNFFFILIEVHSLGRSETKHPCRQFTKNVISEPKRKCK